MKYLLFCIITVLCASLYLYSCANRTIPTGGPKDTIPPNLISVNPENKSLNFNKDKIVLTFDEFIKIKDLNTQLIITPRLDEENEYKVNKNTLTIQLNQKLDSSTTYTFNFQDGVQDINESTPARDLVIAFSTGTYIDSLTIQGTIVELLTNKPVKNAVVALYEAYDTLDIFNSKPQYFTRTKEDGSYRIENLRADTFKIYAFNDQNKNLTAQSDTEAYGFIAKEIVLDSIVTIVDIPLIKRNVKELIIQSARPNGKYYEVKFNKYIEDYSIQSLAPHRDSLISNLINNQNTIRIYNTIQADSIGAEITAIDTIGQALTDTVFIKFPETQRQTDPITSSLDPATKQNIDENYIGKISFNKPTYIEFLDSAFIYYDSLIIDSIKRSELSWNRYHDILTINKKLDKSILENLKIQKDSLNNLPKSATDTIAVSDAEKQVPEVNTDTVTASGRTKPRLTNQNTRKSKEDQQEKPVNKFDKTASQLILFLGKNTFRSVENDTVPEILAHYSFKENKDMALIKGTIITDKESFIIQLIDKTFTPIKEISNSNNFKFQLVPPGEYQLRILIDNDGDGTWEPGNILENQQPEDVIFIGQPIIVRANWEIELESIEL